MSKIITYIHKKENKILILSYIYNFFLGIGIYFISKKTSVALNFNFNPYEYILIALGTTVYYSYLKLKKNQFKFRLICTMLGLIIIVLFTLIHCVNVLDIGIGIISVIVYKYVRYNFIFKNILISLLWCYISYIRIALTVDIFTLVERFLFIYLLCHFLDYSQAIEDRKRSTRTLSNTLSLRQNTALVCGLSISIYLLQFYIYNTVLSITIIVYNLFIFIVLYKKKWKLVHYFIIDFSILIYSLLLG